MQLLREEEYQERLRNRHPGEQGFLKEPHADVKKIVLAFPVFLLPQQLHPEASAVAELAEQNAVCMAGIRKAHHVLVLTPCWNQRVVLQCRRQSEYVAI